VETLTAYTSNDPNGRFTLTDRRIDAVNLARDENAYNYLYKGADYFTGWDTLFTVTPEQASASGAEAAVIGIGDTIGGYNAWSSGIHFDLVYDGSFKFRIVNEATGTSDTSVAVSVSTPYYIKFHRAGMRVKALIYSDSACTALVDTLLLIDVADNARFKNIFAVCSENSASTQTISFSVENVHIYTFEIAEYADLMRVLPAHASHDFETYPNGWTPTAPSGTVLEQSNAWSNAGDYSLRLAGKSDGTDAPSLEQTLSAQGTNEAYIASGYVNLASIADGHNAQLFAIRLYNGSSYRWVMAVCKRTGSAYKWGLAWADSAWTLIESANHRASLNTKQYVQLVGNHGTGGNQTSVTVYVGAQAVAQMDGASLVGYFPNKAVIGKVTTSLGSLNSEFYVDDFFLYHGGILRRASIEQTTDGEFAIAARLAYQHAANADGLAKMIKSTNKSSFTLAATTPTIDTPSYDDMPHDGGIIDVGSDLRYFHTRCPYADGTQNRRTTVYSSADGDEYTSVATQDSYVFQMSRLTTDGKVIGSARYYDSGNLAATNVKFATYNIATGSFSVGATIAAYDDIAGRFPSEVEIFQDPYTGYLVALIRYDNYVTWTGAHQAYRVSPDGGATWGSLVSLLDLWGYKNGRIRATVIKNQLWVTGRSADSDVSNKQLWVGICNLDPDTDYDYLEIVNELKHSYHEHHQEESNGDLTYIEGDWPYIHFAQVAGVLGYYKIKAPVYGPILATPTLTRVGTDIRIDCDITQLLDGDTKAAYYRDSDTVTSTKPDTVGQSVWFDMDDSLVQAGDTFTVLEAIVGTMPDSVVGIAGVERDGVWYWSEESEPILANKLIMLYSHIREANALKVPVVRGLRTIAECSVFSPGGIVNFTGEHSDKFDLSLDSENWYSEIEISEGMQTFYLGITPGEQDTNVNVRLRIPR